MRQFIDIVEGKLLKFDDNFQAYGFWYNPKTGKSVDVTWEHDNDEHHADKVFKDPASFGMPTDRSYYHDRDSEDIRGEVIDNHGWVRVTVTDIYKQRGATLTGVIEGKAKFDCLKTARWLIKSYPEIDAIDLECTETGHKYLRGDELEWFLKKGIVKSDRTRP